MRIVVLDGFAAAQEDLSWDRLTEFGELVVYPRTRAAELHARADGADVLLTNKVLLDRETIESLPRLRYIGIVATGTNVVDLGACEERGVAVTNVPGYSTHSVAQLVLALLLHFTHDVAGHSAAVKSGAWAAAPDFVFCLQPLREVAGKTLAVVGMGAIGRAVRDVATALGMQVLAAAVPGSASADRVPLAEALSMSDFVTLHCPLTPATSRLVGDAFLGAMKPGAVLVNAGRGGLVDEAALARALASGSLGGLALDVLEREPPLPGHSLLDPGAPWAKRVVVTPHVGWATVEARQRLISAVVDNLAAFVRGEARNRVEIRAGAQKLSVPPR
ncbi:MAG TPA: D-2-hydroxyacid dehydrogenase [Polyangiaceae bacterium]